MRHKNPEQNFSWSGQMAVKCRKELYSCNYFCITPRKQQNGKSHPLTGGAPCLQLAANFIRLQIMKGKLWQFY